MKNLLTALRLLGALPVPALLLLGALPVPAIACSDGQFERRGVCYNSLSEIPGRTRGIADDIPAKIADRVKASCTKDFPEDFSTRLYCMGLQFEAYRKLRSDDGLYEGER